MDHTRFGLVKQLFKEALGLTSDERARLLEQACHGDAQLRSEVEELLEHAGAAPDFLHTSHLADNLARLAPQLVPGFRLVEWIGSGASGVVYRAQQLQPRRDVAIKVLRMEATVAHQLDRFQREAQILGALTHPGIARIYETGIVENASVCLPWLAMELVEGRTLDEYAAAPDVDVRARIELLLAVCDALEHAHQRGIVHRDLKPSNVMVDGDGRPRVLDFGVARVLQGDGAAHVTLTRTGAVLGTLSYMAPEQARGSAHEVDARSDVYALGAMLFELLSGRLPLELDELDVLEAVRVVCSVEPPRLRELQPHLPKDLDVVLQKALEKDARRRYAGAGELAADLANVLANRPVDARPRTAFYRARLFVRRNRALSLSTMAVIAALVIGLGSALITLQDLKAARVRSSDTIAFMSELMLKQTASVGFGGVEPADLERFITRIEQQLLDDPTRRTLRAALADAYYERGSIAQGRGDQEGLRKSARAALEIREQLVREDPLDLRSWTQLSMLYAKLGEWARDTGDSDGCDAWFQRALENDERLVREHPGDPELLEDLGWSLARIAERFRMRGELEHAERVALRRLWDAEELVQREPNSWKYVSNLSQVHGTLIELRNRLGCPELAAEHVERSWVYSRRYLDLAPRSHVALHWYIESSLRTANEANRCGRVQDARNMLDEAFRAADELMRADPWNQHCPRLLLGAANSRIRLEPRATRCRFAARTLESICLVADQVARLGAETVAAGLLDDCGKLGFEL